MNFIPRPAADEHDLQQMRSLIQAAWQDYGPMVYYHVAYICLRSRDESYLDWLTLWETPSGELAGFSESDAGMFEWQIHPQYATSSLINDILTWNERPETWRGWTGEKLDTMCAEDDAITVGLLAQHGFYRTEVFYQHHFGELLERIDVPPLPDGYRIQTATEPYDIEQRVAAHIAGWGQPSMSASLYQRLTQTPCYRPELDLMVTDRSGTIIATCNAWLDAVNHVGVFEPLSTHPDHRGRRIAEIMVRTGMQQLRRLGATHALVLSSGQSPHVARLYTGCGLPIVRRDFQHQKHIVHA